MEYSYRKLNLHRFKIFNHLDTILISIGAAFFCTSPLSGLVFLLSFTIFSPFLAFMCMSGALAAHIVASLLHLDKSYMKVGFYGFNGALTGMYWTSLTPFGLTSYSMMIAAAALTVPIMILLNKLLCMSRYNLPPLSLASLIVTYPSIYLMGKVQIAFPPTLIHPAGFGQWFKGEYTLNLAEAANALGGMNGKLFFGILLLMAGVSFHSKRSLGSALKGFLIGFILALILGGRSGAHWTSLFIVTTLPIAIALDGFFLTPSFATRIYTIIALFCSVGVWMGAVMAADELGVPELTIPFFLTTFTAVAIAHNLKLRSKIRGLQPVPLIYVFSPETAEKWYKDLLMAERYWKIISPTGIPNNWEGDMSSKLDRAVDLILKSKSIVLFTGAGVSTESNIPDYRTYEIHWKQYDTSHFRYEKLTSAEESRAKYWEMSQDFYLLIKHARPNKAHLALMELEKLGKLAGIITQNVDRLHHKAGVSAEKIIELHGNELFVTCLQCGQKYTRDEIYDWILNGVKTPYCLSCQGILKPDSIAFGQPMPMHISARALEMTMNCDLFIIMGTSLLVQPAALLPWKAKENGAKLIIINLSSTVYDQHADVLIRDKAGRTMEAIVERITEVRDYIQI